MSAALQDQAANLHPYKTANGYDHKAWAKRVMHRHDNGAKDLLAVQIQFAKMALGLIDEVKA